LCDMSGNVWEWTWDWSGSYSGLALNNPSGNGEGEMRVHRGGSWFDSSGYARMSHRSEVGASSRYNVLGFRLLRLKL